MPLTAAAASLIGTGASAGGGILAGHFNRKLQRETNDRIISSDWERWSRERMNAVDDRNFNNEYNHPKQQMQRLKEAGLSPQLVYGNGQVANTSDAPANASGMSPNIQSPKFNENLVSDVIGQYFNLSQTMAQTDNLKAQAAVINTENLLKQAQVTNLNTQSELGKYDLGFRKATAQANIKHLDLTNDKLQADINYTLNSQQLATLSNTANVAKTYQEIALSKVQQLVQYESIAKSKEERAKIKVDIEHLKSLIELTKNESKIKHYHNEMYAAGMTPSDPAWMRVLIEAANNTSKTIGEIINKFK
jgi:hypothetical protein